MTKKHSSVKEEAKKKNVKDLQGRQSGKPTSPVTAVGPENNLLPLQSNSRFGCRRSRV
ncbi:rCG63314 [Rattus norvegicus]|uniref:RCG63314 n=1 Tax=Rattus norvegicus TaxID=10116 RepID=A6KBP6_RAT|nr:rCG63314 [Rattus norvegicus]